jgi:DnaJ-class molecular chaperone
MEYGRVVTMTYHDLRNALEIFGLSGRATLREIKGRHRELVKRHHPDRGGEAEPERIRLINAAHKVLMEYCEGYAFSFEEAEFYRQNPEERLRVQFADDPLWGRR